MALIARTPSRRLVDLVGTLGGTWQGNVGYARCPAHADSNPSLTLRQGDRGVLVTCFAGCSREDVLRELSRVRVAGHYPQPAQVADRQQPELRVQQLWTGASPVKGTLAERYLRHRGLDPALPDLRFHPRCPFGKKPNTVFEPALLVGVRRGDQVRALQRIFLRRDGQDYTRKAVLGELGDAGWQGGPAGETMAIAEGFEDAAAFQQLHGVASCACLGARRLPLVAVPTTVRTLIIAEDNDVEGRRAARLAWKRHRGAGLVVRRAVPPRKLKDWAKVLES